MNFFELNGYLCYYSDFISLAFKKNKAEIAFLGIESGGRKRIHRDINLLKPGPGIKMLDCKAEIKDADEESISYFSKNGIKFCEITFVNSKKIIFDFDISKVDKKNEIVFNFDLSTVPVTTWSNRNNIDSQKATLKHFTACRKARSLSKLPLVFHFPDFGLLKLSSENDAELDEIIIPDEKYFGLNLGLDNLGMHSKVLPYHKGYLKSSVSPNANNKNFRLQLEVLNENYPGIKQNKLADEKWNGFKRCWENAFTLERHSLTMGDNIFLGGVAHLSMHFKTDMMCFTPDFKDIDSKWDYIRRALKIGFEECIGDSGELSPAFLSEKMPESVPCTYWYAESNASMIIALVNYLRATEDFSFAGKYHSRLKKLIDYIINMDKDNDGIMESDFHGNFFEDEKRVKNWWDNFAFGHKDAYLNLTSYRALKEIFPYIKETDYDYSRKISEFTAKFAENFHSVFYNPKTGVHAGWISRNGKIHDYMFTFISSMAVNQKLVPKDLSSEIMNIFLKKLDEQGYNFKFGIPGPLIPVAPEDTINWDTLGEWGYYENGGFCGQTAYHFIQALYNCGFRHKADEILFSMCNTFEKLPTHSGTFPGYRNSVDWRSKEGLPSGYNYLADNYYFLLAVITGHFKINMPELKISK